MRLRLSAVYEYRQLFNRLVLLRRKRAAADVLILEENLLLVRGTLHPVLVPLADSLFNKRGYDRSGDTADILNSLALIFG
jgi:hypothetical protein